MKHLSTTILAVIFCASVFAQENQRDVVYLTNGIVVRGTITEEIENQFIRINTTEGNFVFSVSDIEKMEKEYLVEEIFTNNETNNILHSVFFEFLGSAGIYNIGYDILLPLAERHKIAVAVGFQYIGESKRRQVFGGSMQINYLYGKTHHLEIGTGISFPWSFGRFWDRRYQEWIWEARPNFIIPMRIGYRYQRSDGGFFGKIAFTPFFNFGFQHFPDFMPWAGIALGYTFRNRK